MRTNRWARDQAVTAPARTVSGRHDTQIPPDETRGVTSAISARAPSPDTLGLARGHLHSFSSHASGGGNRLSAFRLQPFRLGNDKMLGRGGFETVLSVAEVQFVRFLKSCFTIASSGTTNSMTTSAT